MNNNPSTLQEWLDSIGEDPDNQAPDINLSDEQFKAVTEVFDWYNNRPHEQVLTLGGYAGTGKTTIIKYIDWVLSDKNITYCAYTGKAAQVLQSKLGKEVTTIHKQLYRPIIEDEETTRQTKMYKNGKPVYEKYKVGDKKGTYKTDEFGHKIPVYKTKVIRKQKVRGFQRVKELPNVDLIVIDEASMVTSNIFRDLSLLGVRILAVGDHGQLPPVKSKYNLMQDPDIKLEKIFRQAEGSPIIMASKDVREGKTLDYGRYMGSLDVNILPKRYTDRVIDRVSSYILDGDTLMLSAFNSKRIRTNKIIRNKLGFPEDQLRNGEIIICLHNRGDLGIYNGMMFRVDKIHKAKEDHYLCDISDINNEFKVYDKVRIAREQFNNKETMTELRDRFLLFDYGYCLTVHKSQGSEASRVVLFEPHPFQLQQINIDRKRWLYTGITRAKNKLIIIKDYNE